MDLRKFEAQKFPDDGTLVPKHVEDGTWYEMCFVIYFNVT
jgi:hypothetical protein